MPLVPILDFQLPLSRGCLQKEGVGEGKERKGAGGGGRSSLADRRLVRNAKHITTVSDTPHGISEKHCPEVSGQHHAWQSTHSGW